MNEADSFALVPRPPGALEKAEPDGKRILSGMVADTLALVNKESPHERVLSVLVAGSLDSWFGEMFTLLIPQVIVEPVSVEVEHCQGTGTLLKTLEHRTFDIAFVYLHLFSPPPDYKQQFTAARETLHRIKQLPENALITHMGEGLLTIQLLKCVHGIPVVALTGCEYDGAEMLVRRAGADGFFRLGFELQPFIECLQGILLQTPAQRSKPRPPRIVVVDDESFCLGMFSLLIRGWFKDVTLLEFSNSSDAWQELSRTDPDLLILDMPLTGLEMLPLLSERKVKYPILATSGLYQESDVRQQADPKLNVSFLMKPFSAEQFYRCLLTHLGPSDNPERKIEKQAP